MTEPKPLIIDSFEKGIAPSPYLGFADMRNLDIYSYPGIVRLNNLVEKKSASTVTDIPLWFARNPITTTEIWAVDLSAKVYKSTDSGATWAVITGNSSGAGQGMAIYKDYLFVAASTVLETFGPLSGASFTVTIASPAVFSKTAHGLAANDRIVFATTGALPTGLTAGTMYFVIAAGLTADAFEVSTTSGGAAVNTSGSQSGAHTYMAWDLSWQTITSDAAWHPMIVGQDDILYGGAGRYIFSVQELTTFAPGTAATFTWNSQALDLPANYRVKCLAELGVKLMIGTWQGSNVYDTKVADIFPWDRTSSSFDLPIQMNDNGVNAMITVNNLLYIQAGIESRIHVSNGTQTTEISRIPNSLGNLDGGGFWDIKPGGIMTHQGRIFLGAGSGALVGCVGVYSLRPNLGGNILVHENTISTGNSGSANSAKIGALIPVNRDTYLLGWQDSSTYGIDKVNNSERYVSYAGFFISAFYPVGTTWLRRTFEKMRFELNRPLATGQGLRISFRTSLANSFTTIGTYDFATYGSTKTFESVFSIITEKLQIKVELTTAASSNLSPELMYVAFI